MLFAGISIRKLLKKFCASPMIRLGGSMSVPVICSKKIAAVSSVGGLGRDNMRKVMVNSTLCGSGVSLARTLGCRGEWFGRDGNSQGV